MSLVERNVQLEEARLGLGEASITHVLHQVDPVRLAFRKLDWQSVSAPDELQVE